MKSIGRILIFLSEFFLQQKKPPREGVAFDNLIFLLLFFLLFIVFQVNINASFLNIDILLNKVFNIDIVLNNSF